MSLKPWAPLDIIDNFFREGGWDPNTASRTYSFPKQRPSGYSAHSGEVKTFSSFNLEQQGWAQAAMTAWRARAHRWGVRRAEALQATIE
jgi:hypothetical protein